MNPKNIVLPTIGFAVIIGITSWSNNSEVIINSYSDVNAIAVSDSISPVTTPIKIDAVDQKEIIPIPLPKNLKPEIFEAVQAYKLAMSGISKEDLEADREKIEIFKENYLQQALNEETAEISESLFEFSNGDKGLKVAKRVFADGEVRYHLANKYDVNNPDAGWD